MSFVSDIRDFCGDYAIDIKYTENSEDVITLFFNSRRNAKTVKRVIEADDSVPNVATAVDFVEVVRCKDCKLRDTEACPMMVWDVSGILMGDTEDNDFCSYGERREEQEDGGE